MYCQHCGKKLAENETECRECHARTGKNQTEQDYMQYVPTVKKINLLSIIANAVEILFLITLLFLPICQSSKQYDLTLQESWNEIKLWNNLDALRSDQDFIQNGIADFGFSIYQNTADRILLIFGNEAKPQDWSLNLIVVMFGAVGILWAAIYIIFMSFRIYKQGMELGNSKELAMLKYDEIIKTADTKDKKRDLQASHRACTLVFLGGDIACGVLLGTALKMLLSNGIDEGVISTYMMNINGVTLFIIIPVLLLSGMIFVRSWIKKEKKRMRVSITQSQYAS